MQHFDIIIIGAGAAGLMCAHFASENGKSIAVLEHNKQIGRKILISGGGRCNFTNLEVNSTDFYCENPHFVKSALSRFSPWDFISMVIEDGIPYEEKKLGQLFCTKSAKDINALLMKRITKENITLLLNQKNLEVEKVGEQFHIKNEQNAFSCEKLVIATGGLSVPPIGATDFGHKLAKRFGHKIIPMVPALVGFKIEGTSDLSGVSLVGRITTKSGYSITEDILLTHKGLSGPASLKASLYWNSGEPLEVDWLPSQNILELATKEQGATKLDKFLSKYFPNRFAEKILEDLSFQATNIASLKKEQSAELEQIIHRRIYNPTGTEGFRKAEATRGGVDTKDISSKTLESTLCPNLYFIGEVLDVTGMLGGYNFQWAWASGHACGKAIS